MHKSLYMHLCVGFAILSFTHAAFAETVTAVDSGRMSGNGQLASAIPPPKPEPNLTKRYETQVAIGKCVFDSNKQAGPLAVIGGALLMQAIAHGVNRLGATLEEAAKEKTWQVVTSRNVEVRKGSFGPCIQIIRGWFYADPTPYPSEKNDEKTKAAAGSWLDQPHVTQLKENMLWLAAPPDFFFEGQLDTSLSKSAFTVIPRFAQFSNPIDSQWYRSSDRYIAIALTFHPPGTPATEKDNPSTALVLGKMSPNDQFNNWHSHIDLVNSPNRFPGEGPWFELPLNEKDPPGPLTLTVSVTEKRDASEFLAFVAAIFKDSSKEITQEIQNALVPSKRDAEEEEQKKALEKAQNDYDGKYVTALQKLNECIAASAEHEQKALAGRTAVRDLGQAARLANKAYDPEANKIKISGTSVEIMASCTSAKVGLPTE